ncbi:hypothetical protein GCM10023339_39930 [Alloalcanivorax gelatiniphagus]
MDLDPRRPRTRSRLAVPTALMVALGVAAVVPAISSAPAGAQQPTTVQGGPADPAPSAVADDDDTAPASRFTLAVLPDTQFYSRYSADQFVPRYGKDPFEVQTAWLAEHADELNIPFVTHVGDVVDRATVAREWQAADRAMRILDDSDTPYSILAGNHDVLDSNDALHDTDYDLAAEPFLQWFGPSRAAGQSTYGGSDPTGMSQWHVFEAQGQEFLSVALPWRASDATLSWAKAVIAEQDLPTILTSHDLINIGADAVTPKDSAYGERIWNRLINDSDQVFLTLNGHFHGSTHRNRLNAAGHQVTQVLIDHQMAYEGGNGYLGLLELDLTNGTMTMQTGSPWVVSKPQEALTAYDQALLEEPHQSYQVEMDFTERFEAFEPGPADQPSLTQAARDILLDGFEAPEGNDLVQAGSDDDFVEVPGTLAHWRFGDAAPGVVRPGQVFRDVAGDTDLHRVGLTASGSETAEVGDVVVTDDVNPYSSDPGAVCFTNSDQRTDRFSYLQSTSGTPVTETTFPDGYTIETFVKMDADWSAEANQWSKAVVRSGNRSKLPGMPQTRWDYTASPTALGISNLREFQFTEVPETTTKGDRTAWSGEIMVDQWQHVAVVNDATARTTTMYVDGAPVLRNATDTGGASANAGMPWILGADWVDDAARSGWHGCIGETRIIDHPTGPDQWLTARPTLGDFAVTRRPADTVPTGTDLVVLAGTGTPRATVTVDGAVGGTTTVDADGTWRVVADLDASTGTQDYSVLHGFGDRVGEPVTGSFTVTAPGTPSTEGPVTDPPTTARRATSAAAVAGDTVTYGTQHRVTVRVAGQDGTPAGTVAVTSGDRLLGTAALSGGRAVVSLAGTALRPGTHELTAAYAGNGTHAPSSDVVRLRVRKATSRLGVAPTTSRVDAGRRVRLVARLTSEVAPVGDVVVTEKGRNVLRRAARSGRVLLALPALSRGRHVLEVRYTGSDVVSASRTRRVVVVVR